MSQVVVPVGIPGRGSGAEGPGGLSGGYPRARRDCRHVRVTRHQAHRRSRGTRRTVKCERAGRGCSTRNVLWRDREPRQNRRRNRQDRGLRTRCVGSRDGHRCRVRHGERPGSAVTVKVAFVCPWATAWATLGDRLGDPGRPPGRPWATAGRPGRWPEPLPPRCSTSG